jgi:uncharacterized protein YndB with AHSA1/START domain
MNADNLTLVGEITVPAPVSEVWQAWTTDAGVRTFFAPESRIDLRVGGSYELYFDIEAAPGLRGGEGDIILAIQPEKMLSFSWNGPPEVGELRMQHTHVCVYFEEIDPEHTHVTLRHDGWGVGKDWDAVREYFQQAWFKVVLPRLLQRFTHGPIDWEHI